MDWYGNETLHNTPFTNMTINGTPVAAVQNVDNFSFAYVFFFFFFVYLGSKIYLIIILPFRRVYDAGHLVVSRLDSG
jgi:hypothetical protein